MTNFTKVRTQITWKSEAAWPSICHTGKFQSPIDFPSSVNFSYNTTQIIKVVKSSYVKESFKLSVKNDEFFQLEIARNGYIIVAKNNINYRYDGINFNFHYDSEHTIRGTKKDMEIQIIHQKNQNYLISQGIFDDPDKANQMLAISILIKADGPSNPDIEMLNLSTLGPTSKDFDLNRFIPIKEPFYHYRGSLTSSDCTEDINWIVQQNSISISPSQFDMFKNWIIGTIKQTNSREIKPLNGRILFYQYNGLVTQSLVDANLTNSSNIQPGLVSETAYVAVQNELSKSDETGWPQLCREGIKQSPIDFPNTNNHYNKDKIIEIISSHFSPASFKIALLDMRFDVNIYGSGYIMVKKGNILYKYDAYNFHFHYDSEHTFGELHTDLEIHFHLVKDKTYLTTNGVLDDPDKANDILIICIFISANGNIVNETFDKLNIETLGPTSNDFDLNAFVPIKRPVYYYEGSDTKPPCIENVNFIVATDVMLVSEKSVNKIIDWIVTNSGAKNRRNTFPLNDRIVYYQTYSDPILNGPEPEFDNTRFANPASPVKSIETYTGPISWATEDKNTWTDICIQGKEQSPIDLSRDTSKYNQKQIAYIISTHYNLNSYILAIQANRMWFTDMTDGGFILIQFKNVKYRFNVLEFSFHYNSEHTIDGKHSDLEIQIKHKKDANYLRERGWRLDPNNERDLLIISIRFEVGPIDNLNFSKINIQNRGPTLDGFDLNQFIDTSGSFYFYNGSRTLPPCAEYVYWIIMEKTLTISQRQLDEVKSWIKNTTTEMNSRSVKKIYARDVYYTKNPHNLLTNIDVRGRSNGSSNKLIPRLIISISLMLLII